MFYEIMGAVFTVSLLATLGNAYHKDDAQRAYNHCRRVDRKQARLEAQKKAWPRWTAFKDQADRAFGTAMMWFGFVLIAGAVLALFGVIR